MTARTPSRSDAAVAILRALRDVPEPEWCARFLGYSKSLASRVDRAYVKAHPDRRNRPQGRNVERALRALSEAGEVETKMGTAYVPTSDERYYRLTPAGRKAATEL